MNRNATLHVLFDITPGFAQVILKGFEVMSKISDAIAAANTAADEAIARVQEDVSKLQSQVDTLQKRVDEDAASPEDIANLESLKAKLGALDPVSPATLPTDGTTDPNAVPPVTEPAQPGPDTSPNPTPTLDADGNPIVQ